MIFALWVVAFVWGACWGSFLNVVIHRVPRDESVVSPGSRCGACGAAIRPWHNIPIVSYLALRGRCADCGARFSPRYMLVEAACGVLALVLFRGLVDPTDPDALLPGLALWGYWQIFVYALVALTFIDLEHTLLPWSITLPTTAVGLIGAFALPSLEPWSHVWGLAAGVLFFGFIYGLAWLMFKREALGLGDVVIAGMLGAWVGWQAMPFVVLAACTQGLLAAGIAKLYTVVTGKQNALTLTTAELDARFDEVDEHADLPEHTAIPFGPFLALGGLEALLFGTSAFWAGVDAVVAPLLRALNAGG
jgi:leader peptidase (prepilin peptidase)/N-methyltransferase